MVEHLSKPDPFELSSATRYSRSFLSQFTACLWKQNLSYWRNPQYTAVRLLYTVIISLMFGTMCWKFGSKRGTQQDISNAMGSMYAAVLFIGITNATAVQPVVSVERFVSYRESGKDVFFSSICIFAGLKSLQSSYILHIICTSRSLSNETEMAQILMAFLKQVTIEFPYVFVQSVIYSGIFYFMASFEWNLVKFAWYLFFMYFTLLYFTFFGMMTIAVTPNHNAAAIVAAPFYMMWNLFSGFMISQMRIPVWWRWYYWANPIAWSLYGLLTSQYGTIDDIVMLSDGVRSLPMRQLLKDQYGYRHDFLVIAAIVVPSFCVVFAVTFAFAIKSFNFQRR